MNARDGGAAFPGGELRYDDGDCKTPYNAGMTLRDWFAGQAIPAAVQIILHPQAKLAGGNPGPGHVALTAYDIADAMLAARTEGRQP